MKRSISGILIFLSGIAIGVATYYLIDIGQNPEIVTDHSAKVTVPSDSSKSLLTESRPPLHKKNNHTVTNIDSILAEIDKNDTASTLREADTSEIEHDTSGLSAKSLGANNELITVRKDELIYRLNLPIHSSEVPAEIDPLDSLLIEDRYSKPDDQITTELWVSPLNYRGYKMSKKKLILFGIDAGKKLSLFYLKKNYYLKYGEIYYSLRYQEEFTPYTLLSDPETLQLLNEIND
ncbi:MAG: hypothetical protein KKA07_12390 [Bacteroidetes bacterium]|nr:hypothetical protein [Bacteroidota bacterium]MBU1719857.1 hypothetical protein [Bacteroidota bacterium]